MIIGRRMSSLFSSSSASKTKKPTVVLAGWLGCQPSKLRRYQEFYHERGYPTLIRIATAQMVVSWTIEQDNSSMMQDLAWDVLRQLHQQESHRFLIHAFSNGGCFLYEQLRRLLLPAQTQTERRPSPPQCQSQQVEEHEQQQNIPNNNNNSDDSQVLFLQQFRLVGAVLDSCPALDLTRIDLALSYCTQQELDELEQSSFLKPFLKKNYRQVLFENQSLLLTRQEEYRRFMTEEDGVGLPQLFIYSRNDPITPFEPLDALVEARQQQQKQQSGNNNNSSSSSLVVVRKLVLDDSPHCAHFLRHPELYREALDSFLHDFGADNDHDSHNNNNNKASMIVSKL